MYTYDDYIELKQLFLGWLRDNVPMDRKVMQEYWKELKRMERETRCIDKNGKRCMEDCKQCNHNREGFTLSLDQLMEAGIFFKDASMIETHMESLEVLRSLSYALNALPEQCQDIIHLYMAGFSEREIGKILGLKQKYVNYWKNKALTVLKEKLKDFV